MKLRKIFPSGVQTDAHNTFNVVLLSEGYKVEERRQFSDVCGVFVNKLLSTRPFNLTNINPYWISVFSGFAPSDNSGVGIDGAFQGRTAFESVYDTPTRTVSLNRSKVDTLVESSMTFPFEDGTVPAVEVFLKESNIVSQTGTVLAVLMPPVAGESDNISLEYRGDPDHYDLVATTTNHEWSQIVLRAICSRLGLGDEFERSGPEFQSAPDRSLFPFNIHYFDSPPTSFNGVRFKWRSYLSVSQKTKAPDVQAHVGDLDTPNNPTQNIPNTPSEVGFWEGAAGFRTKAYRSALDCLMHRRPGDHSIPVGNAKVPLCRVCQIYIRSLIE